METIKITFNHDDSDYLITKINGSRETIAKYYMFNWFNMGTTSDVMKQCTKIEFLDN